LGNHVGTRFCKRTILPVGCRDILRVVPTSRWPARRPPVRPPAPVVQGVPAKRDGGSLFHRACSQYTEGGLFRLPRFDAGAEFLEILIRILCKFMETADARYVLRTARRSRCINEKIAPNFQIGRPETDAHCVSSTAGIRDEVGASRRAIIVPRKITSEWSFLTCTLGSVHPHAETMPVDNANREHSLSDISRSYAFLRPLKPPTLDSVMSVAGCYSPSQAVTAAGEIHNQQ
jgi:hypothetical protein